MRIFPTTLLVLWSLAGAVCADEGMWLYNDPPRQLLEERYGFTPAADWLEHLQKSSVRFNSGGSGSFVSADGLLLTNHHVGAGELQKFSDEKHNYLRDGFHATTLPEEKRCFDLELNVLESIEDVTDRVNSAVAPGLSADAAFAARRAVTASIEKTAQDKTGLRSDVVSLYGGAKYHLYQYKRYTDVRLVFAPEQQAAFFGGDPDNFEYPRFNLDICLFRAYEDGQPAKISHFLKWSKTGVAENDLVFVSGHPGRTDRQLTIAELEYLRDQSYPLRLSRLYDEEVHFLAWGARSDENARRARENLFGVQNSRKASEGKGAGLLDPAVMAAKQTAEDHLRQSVASTPALQDTASAWDQIDAAQKVIAQNARRTGLFEQASGFNSKLFNIGRTLLRAAEERSKPNGERLREFRDSNKESLELGLFSEEPVYDDFETAKLANSLTWLTEQAGGDDPLVKQVLAGQPPAERAAALVAATKLGDVAVRRKLYAADPAGVAAAQDPMIELARLIDPESRRLRKLLEPQDEIKRQAYARITAAKFALDKGASYPDATFTLRLAFGSVRGYEENGQAIPFQTTFAGFFDRAALHHDQPPFDLPQRWIERKDRLDLSTPFNFVCTADIIGGNSGSPVVNRAGEFVGIIFDGNLQSLVLDFAYTEKQARAVSVNSQAITEALRKIYDAGEVAQELESGRRP